MTYLRIHKVIDDTNGLKFHDITSVNQFKDKTCRPCVYPRYKKKHRYTGLKTTVAVMDFTLGPDNRTDAMTYKIFWEKIETNSGENVGRYYENLALLEPFCGKTGSYISLCPLLRKNR